MKTKQNKPREANIDNNSALACPYGWLSDHLQDSVNYDNAHKLVISVYKLEMSSAVFKLIDKSDYLISIRTSEDMNKKQTQLHKDFYSFSSNKAFNEPECYAIVQTDMLIFNYVRSQSFAIKPFWPGVLDPGNLANQVLNN